LNVAIAPIVDEKTLDSITLVMIDGYECSIDGEVWQSSPVFMNLSPNTSYTFYQRIKETFTHKASANSRGLSVKTISPDNIKSSSAYYYKLRSYIDANGKVNTQGDKTISQIATVESMKCTFILTNADNGIMLCLHVEYGNIINRVDFILTPTSKDLSVNYTVIRSLTSNTFTTVSIDRSKYIGTGSYYDSLFDQTMETLCVYWDEELYQTLGFGLIELGFHAFEGYGSAVCDAPSGYHIGSTGTRNVRASSCLYEGNTGDVYCIACNSTLRKGQTQPATPHQYFNNCDTSCNSCGWKRVAIHEFDANCDSQCNACGAGRTVTEQHVYDNDLDRTCNSCGVTRKLSLTYGWNFIGDKWYYYKTNGMLATGWVYDGAWYYMDANGVMLTGWVLDGNTWYYMNSSGAMQTGWLYDGAWYYLTSSGAMATGWVNVGGTWYYMNGSGAMMTGWVLNGGTWYYMNASGAMQTGWVLDGGTWYYMNSSGAMQTGWILDGGVWYYLNASGAWVA
jgi:glucan-binding YG repeat protein